MFSSLISCPVAANSYTLTGFICQATLLVLQVVPVLVSLALLFFFWGIATWILSLSSGDEEGVKKGRERTVWGLVALFFILSIGGVITILMNTFFTGGTGNIRQAPPSGYTQPLGGSFSGSGSVQAPVSVTGGTQGGTEPGFFRRVWCSIGFTRCNSTQNTQPSSAGGGGGSRSGGTNIQQF